MNRKKIIEKKDKIDRNVYAFWTGKNVMSVNRRECLKSLEDNFSLQNINFILVDEKKLSEYVKKSGVELHQGYKYLSETAKSDYLRCYFMHFFGGGYTDIKYANGKWKNSFLNLEKNKNKYCSGYREEKPEDTAVVFDNNWNIVKEKTIELKKNYDKLLGMCCFIFKKNTPITLEWYNNIIKIMDNNLQKLKEYPSKSPQQNLYGINPEYPHPIPWAGVGGVVLHPLFLKYKENLDYTLPRFRNHIYR